MKEIYLKRLYVVGFHFYAILERATEIRSVVVRNWGWRGMGKFLRVIEMLCIMMVVVVALLHIQIIIYICEFNLIPITTTPCEGYY